MNAALVIEVVEIALRLVKAHGPERARVVLATIEAHWPEAIDADDVAAKVREALARSAT